jgi:predicted O-linked N-acetylglucosamine transferase (SPINDLY family)
MDEPVNIRAIYERGDFAAVIALLAPLAKDGSLTDENLLALLAQSQYRAGNLEQAAWSYLRAGECSRAQASVFLEIAYKLFTKLENPEGVARSAARLFALDPTRREIALQHRQNLRKAYDFDGLHALNRMSYDAYRRGNPYFLSLDMPFNHIAWCGDEGIMRFASSMQAVGTADAEMALARRAQPHPWGDKIRIGYLSSDFYDIHATTALFQGVLDCHDAERFDITLFCSTRPQDIPRDQGFRGRHQARIVPLWGLTTEQARDAIGSRGIDILVDMKGYTSYARCDVINAGAAPIQVSWLGYPGSCPGLDNDYIIGDPFVTPDNVKGLYHEKLCRLPDTYQCNDNIHRAMPQAVSRAELGLPEDRFVFASFNAAFKLNSGVFDIWAKIVAACPPSVLWIMCPQDGLKDSVAAAFEKRGISQDRLIFAGRTSQSGHVARLAAADLGLDTFPYNGHTTTSDALWAGLPVATFKGTSFASRVSESLLNAMQIPELVAVTPEDYIRLCSTLAYDPDRLGAIRERIAANRFTAPLFDTRRFTRNLETGFEMMMARAKAGLPPDHIDVPQAQSVATS